MLTKARHHFSVCLFKFQIFLIPEKIISRDERSSDIYLERLSLYSRWREWKLLGLCLHFVVCRRAISSFHFVAYFSSEMTPAERINLLRCDSLAYYYILHIIRASCIACGIYCHSCLTKQQTLTSAKLWNIIKSSADVV